MSESRPDHMTWRHWTVAGLMLLAIAAVIVRLVEVQILDHEQYREQAAVTRQGEIAVTAPRGAILDATGYPLATSTDTWDIYLDRFLWRDEERAAAAAAELTEVIDVDRQAVLELGTAEDRGDVLLRRDVPYEVGREIQERGLWGVRPVPSAVRVYPEGDLAGQLIGYVGRDGEGLWGVEADFDHMLRGYAGWFSVERDAYGRPISFSPRAEQLAAPGGEVQLTIDRFIQGFAEQHLAEALAEHQAPSGSIIVMEPDTGAILAMTSIPSVHLSEIDLQSGDLGDRIRNRAITDMYEPGSVLKTLTTAIAIDEGLVGPESTYNDTGEVEVGGYTIMNWDYQAYGPTTVREYLQRSLNTGSVWLADLIGANDFYEGIQRFGLTEQTHIGLSGEAEGMMRTTADPDWYPVDLATNSYGQGIAATPLQVLTAVNAFANDGMLMRPYIVSKSVTEERTRSFDPVEVRQVVSPETADTMAALMRDVVEGVEWHGARVPGYEVAGKTGTTLVSIPTGYDLDTTIASFAGFIPYDDPQVSVLIKIDQPGGDMNLGGQVAAPVFAGLAADIMEYLDVPPDHELVSTP